MRVFADQFTYTYACMHTYVHTFMHMFVYVYIRIQVRTCVHTYICMHCIRTYHYVAKINVCDCNYHFMMEKVLINDQNQPQN